jgi:hypothetical protein
VSVEARPDRAMRPWGVPATIGFTIVIFIVFVVVQIGVAFAYLIVKGLAAPATTTADMEAAAAGLEKDGLFLGLTEQVAGPVVLGVTILFAWLRKGLPLRDYLALRPVPRHSILWWLLCTMLVTGLLDVVGYFAGYPQVPTWMMDVYRSAVFLPLLFVALVVVAPVLEELVFRGFVFEGLRHSRLGSAGAILLTALVWACIHLQYEWFYVAQIFVVGLVLGAARASTGSLLPAIVAHALMNATATLQAALVARPASP